MMSVEHWWNDTDRGNLKYSEKDLSQCHFVITNLTWTALGSKPSLRGGGPVMTACFEGLI